ncbi:MAG: response regulator [Acidobacteriota bacterium]|nr:response regulator [Acidobacteriota bacterium]
MGTAGRILIVDDEALLRWSLGEAFRGAGFDVAEAPDARSGRQQFEDARPFDVALLDCRLPDADGLSLCGELHRSQPACVCFMMTAFRTPNLADEAARLGARDVLDKPFDVERVVELVRRHLLQPPA